MIKNLAVSTGAACLLLAGAAAAQDQTSPAATKAPGNPPSLNNGANRNDCIPSINATAGHDLLGRNAIAGVPYQPENPECNVFVDKNGHVALPSATTLGSDASALARDRSNYERRSTGDVRYNSSADLYGWRGS